MSSVGGAGHGGHVVEPDAETAPVAIEPTPGSVVHDVHGPAAPAGADRLRVHFEARPSEARVGEPVTLRFHIERADGGGPARLATVHEKKVHTIVVSNDLAEFAHIHPEARRGGTYAVEYAPARAGGHTVFAEMTAAGRGARAEVKPFDLDVAGRPARPVALKPDTRAKTVGSLEVDIETEPRTVRAGEPVVLAFDLRDAATGRPPRDLEPYLGEVGHAISVSADRKHFLHAHPFAGGGHGGHGGHGGRGIGPADGKVRFQATFPEPGLYKVWGQFRRDGKDLTVPFVLKVAGRSG